MHMPLIRVTVIGVRARSVKRRKNATPPEQRGRACSALEGARSFRPPEPIACRCVDNVDGLSTPPLIRKRSLDLPQLLPKPISWSGYGCKARVDLDWNTECVSEWT